MPHLYQLTRLLNQAVYKSNISTYMQQRFSTMRRFKNLCYSHFALNNLTVESVYNQMMNQTRVDEDGHMQFESKNLTELIDLIQSKEDVDTVIKAFYNMKGHKVEFECKEIDRLTLKAVEFECPEAVFDIFNYHHFLRYYPAPHATNEVLTKLIAQNDVEGIQQFLSIIQSRKLIKINEEFIENVENCIYYNLGKDVEIESFLDN